MAISSVPRVILSFSSVRRKAPRLDDSFARLVSASREEEQWERRSILRS